MKWDEIFRASFQRIEPLVSGVAGDYRGTSFEALYTSAEDFKNIFSSLNKQGTFVDLGAGVGQGCLIYSWLYPAYHSIAIDLSLVRLQEGRRLAQDLGLSNISFIHGDLLELEIPPGDIYFLYFPTGPVLDRILSSLHQQGRDFYLVVVESHGDLFLRLEKENWLNFILEIPLQSLRHEAVARVYQSKNVPRCGNLLPHDLSFQKQHLLVKDGDGSLWWGESYGLEWVRGEQYQMICPPRTLLWSQVLQVASESELSRKLWSVILWRRQGRLKIESKRGTLKGFIRKILISPRFSLEISTGEQVEWLDIVTINLESSS